MSIKYNLVTVLGPTASGKTKLAAALANEFNGEIISCDSRQFYRGMDIGTGKDYEDYIVNGQKVPVHLIDFLYPSDDYDVFHYQKDFLISYSSISSDNKIPFMVGGSGLYLSSILQQYRFVPVSMDEEKIAQFDSISTYELKNRLLAISPKLHNTTDLIERDRIIRALIITNESRNGGGEVSHPVIVSFNIYINPERQLLKDRIAERLEKRLNSGMIEEVKTLLENNIPASRLNYFGLEYRFITMYLLNEISLPEMIEKLRYAIFDFAKRQVTWFRRMEKQGVVLHKVDEPYFENASVLLQKIGITS